MRKAIVYASVHHGNTEKLVKGIAEECQVDLIDAVKQPDVDLSSYDMIGFASGIYFSKFHQSILGFAEKNLPDDKKVFLICTYGGSANYKSIKQILDEKRSKVIGKFGCKGYDTFGPFKLVGGIAKGHPDDEDIKNYIKKIMTGGKVLIIGKTGKNFAAGMSGGVAYVLDEDNDLYLSLNKEMVSSEPVVSKYDVMEIKDMITAHVAYTNSEKGKEILNDFSKYLPKFKKIIPHDYKKMLKKISEMEGKGLSAEQAQIEAFYEIKRG